MSAADTIPPEPPPALPRLFEGLSAVQRQRVQALGRLLRVQRGETIFQQGAQDDALFVLLEGEVDIAMVGATVAVGTVRAGDVLGEVAMLLGHPHSATAIAACDGWIVALSRAQLAALAQADPVLATHLMTNLARSLAHKLQAADLALGALRSMM